MAIDARLLRPDIPMSVRVPDVSQAINIFENALMNSQPRDLRASQEARAAELAPFNLQKAQQGIDTNQQALQAGRAQQALNDENRILRSVSEFGTQLKPVIESGNLEQAQTMLSNRLIDLDSQNLPTNETVEAITALRSNDPQSVLSGIDTAQTIARQRGLLGGAETSVRQREFDSHIATAQNPNATQLERDSANRALGNKARATGAASKAVDVGGVPHIFDPVRQTLVPAVIGGAEVTTETISKSEAGIAGAVSEATETAKIEPELRKQTQKQNSQRISELTRSEKARSSSVNKARRFLKAFESSAESGASRSALSFLPGVFTTQSQFDAQFNAFSEVAARQQLKAAGETRPTDADVEGMKRAIFGVGRDEVTNINLLKEFINDKSILDIELDELRDAKSLGKLSTFTGAPISAVNTDITTKDLTSLSVEELQAELERLGGK